MIDIDSSFIIQLINFLVLMLILNTLLFKPILGILEKREKEISGETAGLGSMQSEIDGLKADNLKRISDARADAIKVIDATRKEMAKKQEEIIGGARTNYQDKFSKAKGEIMQESEKASVQLKEDASLLAKSLVSKVLGREIS